MSRIFRCRTHVGGGSGLKWKLAVAFLLVLTFFIALSSKGTVSDSYKKHLEKLKKIVAAYASSDAEATPLGKDSSLERLEEKPGIQVGMPWRHHGALVSGSKTLGLWRDGKTGEARNSSFHAPKNAVCKVPIPLPAELESRHQRTAKVCRKLKSSLPQRFQNKRLATMTTHLRLDRTRRLGYCHVPKVASTTWAWHLLRGIGMDDDEIAAHDNVHILLQSRLQPPSPPELTKNSFRNYFLFLVVRHPFQRLLSAYRNKISNGKTRRPQYRKLQKTILGMYRNSTSSPKDVPTFQEFVDYVVDTVGSWLNGKKHHFPDLHWMPISYICFPCHLNYTIISKLETMEEDTRFIGSQCGMEDVYIPKMKMNPSNTHREATSGGKNPVKMNAASTVQKKNDTFVADVDDHNHNYTLYFQQITPRSMQKLYNIYYFDFQIFGYFVDDIFSYH